MSLHLKELVCASNFNTILHHHIDMINKFEWTLSNSQGNTGFRHFRSSREHFHERYPGRNRFHEMPLPEPVSAALLV